MDALDGGSIRRPWPLETVTCSTGSDINKVHFTRGEIFMRTSSAGNGVHRIWNFICIYRDRRQDVAQEMEGDEAKADLMA